MSAERPLGVGQFLALALAVVGGGAVLGVRRHLRSEQFRVHLRDHATPIGVASKALLYGTLLCGGAFAGSVGAACILSGIYSPAEFGSVARRKLSGLAPPATEEDAEARAFSDMFVDEETGGTDK